MGTASSTVCQPQCFCWICENLFLFPRGDTKILNAAVENRELKKQQATLEYNWIRGFHSLKVSCPIVLRLQDSAAEIQRLQAQNDGEGFPEIFFRCITGSEKTEKYVTAGVF